METYKIAENKMFHAAGHDFIFLAVDNTIFEIDDRTKGLLTKRGIAEAFIAEEAFAALSCPPEDKRELFEDLIKSRAVISSNDNGGQKQIDFEKMSIELKTLVLHVTDACNLGCRYCYYGNGDHAAVAREKMSPETAARAVDFLMEHSGNLKEVIIVFFGGEPLLNLELMRFIVADAQKKAMEKGIRVDFAVTTNGTLFTDKAIAFLRENHIGVTISMDGFETAHDRFRRFPNGAPSYGAILPGLARFLSDRGEKPVVARVTVAGESKDIPEILDHLLALGFSEAGFAPVTTGDLSYQLSPGEMAKLLAHFKTLSEIFLSHAKKDEFYGFTNLIDNLVVLHEGERKDYPCGAGMGLFSVDPKGGLYLCQRLTGEASSRMGDIFSGFDHAALNRFRKQAFISEKKACAECWVRKICAGGCYHEALVREGGLLQPNLHYCQWIKDWVEMGLAVYGELAVECPDYLEKLSMMRGHAPLLNHSI
jgi:uncharacterized protein